MKRRLLIMMLLTVTLTVSAQSNKTVETQKDQYGHITGTTTTTYKDRYGHVTGSSTTR